MEYKLFRLDGVHSVLLFFWVVCQFRFNLEACSKIGLEKLISNTSYCYSFALNNNVCKNNKRDWNSTCRNNTCYEAK